MHKEDVETWLQRRSEQSGAALRPHHVNSSFGRCAELSREDRTRFIFKQVIDVSLKNLWLKIFYNIYNGLHSWRSFMFSYEFFGEALDEFREDRKFRIVSD